MTLLLRRLFLALMGSIGPLAAVAAEPPPEIAKLIRQLGSEDFQEREAASRKLELIGPPAIDLLEPILEDRDAEVRNRVKGILETIETRYYGRPLVWGGRRLSHWCTAATSKDLTVRLPAAQALAKLVFAGERVLPSLLPLVADPEAAVRLEAVRAVGGCGPAARAAIEPLKVALKDDNEMIRLLAARAVWAIDARGDLVVPVLTATVLQQGSPERVRAAAFLGQMGPYGRDAVPVLTKALAGQPGETRTLLASALWSIDRQDKAAHKTLFDPLLNEPAESPSELLRMLTRSLPARAEFAPVFLRATLQGKGLAATHGVRGLRGLDALPAAVLNTLLDKPPAADAATATSIVQVLGEMAPTNPAVVRALAKVAGGERDQRTRQLALQALVPSGPAAQAALPALLAALKDPTLRSTAVPILGNLGGGAQEAVPALIDLLKQPNPNLRPHVLRALEKIGPDAKAAVPALVGILDDHYTKDATSAALVAIGPASIEPLVEALRHKNAQLAMQSAHALARFEAQAVPPLANLVTAEENKTVRWLAAHALSVMGPPAKPALPVLLAGLKAADPPLRRACARAIAKIEPLPAEVLPVLVKLVSDGDSENQSTALDALGALGPAARAALPAVTKVLDKVGHTYRIKAAEAVARIDPKSPQPLAVLIEAAKSERVIARSYAYRALGRLGAYAVPAVRQVAAGIEDKDVTTRHAARQALVELTPFIVEFTPEVVTAMSRPLREMVTPEQRDLRINLAQRLGRLGAKAKAMLPTLLAVQRTLDKHPCPQVALALWQIDRSPIALRGLLEILTTNTSGDTRATACAVLAEMGPDARAALPSLVLACQSTGGTNTGDLRVRPAAARALWKIDPTTRDWVLPVLLETLRDGSYPDARILAAQTLGELGAAARVAVPLLQRTARAPEELVRRAATAALARIEAKPD